MWLRWEQVDSYKNNVQIWNLVFKDTGARVVIIKQSSLAEQKDNYRMRMKIKRMYEWYFTKVWLENLRFY